MSVVTEIRNTQANYKDKCELVIGNPCFNNRFYSVKPIESFNLLSNSILELILVFFKQKRVI